MSQLLTRVLVEADDQKSWWWHLRWSFETTCEGNHDGGATRKETGYNISVNDHSLPIQTVTIHECKYCCYEVTSALKLKVLNTVLESISRSNSISSISGCINICRSISTSNSSQFPTFPPQQHLESCTSRPAWEFECPYCAREFATKRGMTTHCFQCSKRPDKKASWMYMVDILYYSK